MKNVVVILIVFLMAGSLYGQSFYSLKHDRNFIAFLGTGTSSYFGELNNPGDYMDAKLNVSIGLQYLFLDRFAVSGELTWFQLSGDDAEADHTGRTSRGLSFFSDNIEFSVRGIVYLFPKDRRYYRRKNINFYAFLGIGMAYYNPKADIPTKVYNGVSLPDAGGTTSLRPLQTEGVSYSSITPVIPLGLGVHFKVSPFINIALEGGFRKTFTDYLDDVSTKYADKSNSSPLTQAMADKRWVINLPNKQAGSKRGDNSTDDAYFIMNVKVECYLPPTFLSGINKSRNPRKFKRRKIRRPKSRGRKRR